MHAACWELASIGSNALVTTWSVRPWTPPVAFTCSTIVWRCSGIGPWLMSMIPCSRRSSRFRYVYPIVIVSSVTPRPNSSGASLGVVSVWESSALSVPALSLPAGSSSALSASAGSSSYASGVVATAVGSGLSDALSSALEQAAVTRLSAARSAINPAMRLAGTNC